mmetsp:Transcript_72901/g.170773  ORF Transcript_72901/g.170773 Transcript_72901/m.170773 type:complete len:192 (-) Transcript_72901:187-762(-)
MARRRVGLCVLLLFAGLAAPQFAWSRPSYATDDEPSQKVFQVLGWHSADLFPVTNLSLLSWIALIFCPSWRHLKSIVLFGPVVNAVVYTMVVGFVFTHPDPDAKMDLADLSGIVALYRNDDSVFAGWLHYCVFDPLIGLGEVLDSQAVGVPHLFVVPCLILTLFLGPMGFLLYLTARALTRYVKDDGFQIL